MYGVIPNIFVQTAALAILLCMNTNIFKCGTISTSNWNKVVNYEKVTTKKANLQKISDANHILLEMNFKNVLNFKYKPKEFLLC